jgi:molybdenum cofactor cytidylyltransferase
VRPALVILAAGASRRLGEPKALADIGGMTVLDRLLDAGACLDGRPLVVAGAHWTAISAAAGERADCAHNSGWESGRTGSVMLAARERAGRDLCIAPVDVPLVPRSVFEELADAWERAGRPPHGWLAPRCSGRFGHPVVIGRELLATWKDVPPDRPLRELRELAGPLLACETASSAVLDDLDTPSDLASLRARASSP